MVETVLVVDPEDGEYTAKVSWNENRIVSVERVCGNPDSVLMPGFVDVHTHGAFGINSMTMSYEDIENWEKQLYAEGVTYFLPTTVSAYAEEMNGVNRVVSGYLSDNPASSVSGLHFEGPFVNVAKKGSQNPSRIRQATIEELKSISLNNVMLMTMAPEIAGFEEALPLLVEKGVVVSLGHTNTTFAEKTRYSLQSEDPFFVLGQGQKPRARC